MKTQDIIISEEKVRLDPACWDNKKIGNPKTKMKGGVRVNNCVPAESIAEGEDIDAKIANLKDAIRFETPRSVPGEDHREQYARHAEKIAGYKAELKKLVAQKKQGVAEGSRNAYLKHNNLVDIEKPLAGLKSAFEKFLQTHDPEEKQKYQQGIKQRIKSEPMSGPKGQLPEQGVAEEWSKKYKDSINCSNPKGFSQKAHCAGKAKNEGVAESSGEYNDEAGMAHGSLLTVKRAVDGLMSTIDRGDDLPEWCQEKISLAEDYLVTVWDYIQSEKEQGIDPEIEEMYEAMDELAEEMAQKKGVSVDLVWETFESMDDNMLYETAAWRRKEGKSKTGGLNAKGVASYRRENPGSKLQTAVTTKPSKLKKGSKAAKRRKSFCARMSGVKGPMKKPNGKPTRKALALRKWNC